VENRMQHPRMDMEPTVSYDPALNPRRWHASLVASAALVLSGALVAACMLAAWRPLEPEQIDTVLVSNSASHPIRVIIEHAPVGVGPNDTLQFDEDWAPPSHTSAEAFNRLLKALEVAKHGKGFPQSGKGWWESKQKFYKPRTGKMEYADKFSWPPAFIYPNRVKWNNYHGRWDASLREWAEDRGQRRHLSLCDQGLRRQDKKRLCMDKVRGLPENEDDRQTKAQYWWESRAHSQFWNKDGTPRAPAHHTVTIPAAKT